MMLKEEYNGVENMRTKQENYHDITEEIDKKVRRFLQI